MLKSILQIIYSCSVQKTAPKNTKYSRNETILKIAYHVKAIAHAKSHFGSKIKIPKNMSKSTLYITFTVVLCKKPLQKTPNIREMRPF